MFFFHHYHHHQHHHHHYFHHKPFTIITIIARSEEKLSHPSYVYTAQFHPASSTLLATAGFDRVIRLWGCGRGKAGGGYQVVQELPGHSDHLNCLAFDLDGHFLFSGDAGGVIRMWESPEPTVPLGSSTDSYSYNLPGQGAWRSKREYRVEGVESHSICSLSPHPGGRRLLVHSLHPSSPLKMLDLRSGSVMQSYPDIQSFRPPAPSTISPCGSWVLGGSSCGLAIAWNTDTGDNISL